MICQSNLQAECVYNADHCRLVRIFIPRFRGFRGFVIILLRQAFAVFTLDVGCETVEEGRNVSMKCFDEMFRRNVSTICFDEMFR